MKWQGGRRFCGREPFERIWCVALVLALAFSVFDLSWMLRSAYFARRAELADEASRTTFSPWLLPSPPSPPFSYGS